MASRIGIIVAVAALAIPAGARAEPVAADPPKLAGARPIVPPDVRFGTKAEATTPERRSALQPSDATPRRPSLRPPHRTKLAAFDPSRFREHSSASNQLDDIVRSWKSNTRWDAITVDGYDPRGSAERIRAYLVRRGIPADFVTAVAHTGESRTPGASLEVSVTTCDDVTIACRRPAPPK